jgi:hypothetical protein
VRPGTAAQEANMSSEFPRVYRISTSWRVAWIVMSVALVAICLFLAWFIVRQNHDAPNVTLVTGGGLCVVFLLMGVYLIAAGVRTKIVLTAGSIALHGALLVRQLARADIAGRRLIKQGNGYNVLHLVPKDSRGKRLQLSYYLQTDAVLNEWIGGIPDLDAAEAKKSEAALLANTDLGVTPNERRARLARGRTVAQWFRWATLAIALWGWFYPRPYDLMLVTLALLPWVAIAMVVLSHGLYRFNSNRNEVNPELATTLLLPGLVLLLRAIIDASVIDWEKAVLFAVIAGASILLVTVLLVTELREQLGAKVVVGLFMCAYAYGVIVLANVQLDTSEATRFGVQVMEKHVVEGEGAGHRLTLSAWGPHTVPENVSVGRSLYEALSVGDTVCVHLMSGAFRISWFTVNTCPSSG